MREYNKQTVVDEPLVSIITVALNSEKYLAQTIQSVISQTYANIEYIIIDGGSTDGTLDIIKKYEDRIDYWISEPDEGHYDAMNKGIKFANGQYIIHLHSDDSFTNEMGVFQLVQGVINSRNDWATGFHNVVDGDGRLLKADTIRKYTLFSMFIRNIIKHEATIVSKNHFRNRSFDKNFPYAADYKFFYELWEQVGEPNHVMERLVNFRAHKNSVSSNFLASMTDELKVKIHNRFETLRFHYWPIDFLVYVLRVLKLLTFHQKFAKQITKK